MQELTAYKAKVEAAEGGASEPEKMNADYIIAPDYQMLKVLL